MVKADKPLHNHPDQAARQLARIKLDTYIGMGFSNLIAFFIMLTTAATLHASGLTNITDAAEAAKALIPLAGKWAGLMFALGLLNASLFAATILPLSTAHVICEGLGFEAGIDHKFREAPAFYWLYTLLIVAGAGIVLIPNVPLWKIFIFSQVGNGVWLPVVVIFILLLINDRRLTKELKNTRFYNILGWATFAIITLAVAIMLLMQFLGLWGGKLFGS